MRQQWRLVSRSAAYWAILALSVLLAGVVGQIVLWHFQPGFVGALVGIQAMVVFFTYIQIILLNLLFEKYRIAVWLDHHLCPDCGYDLTGNTSGVCPECGTACTTPENSPQKIPAVPQGEK